MRKRIITPNEYRSAFILDWGVRVKGSAPKRNIRAEQQNWNWKRCKNPKPRSPWHHSIKRFYHWTTIAMRERWALGMKITFSPELDANLAAISRNYVSVIGGWRTSPLMQLKWLRLKFGLITKGAAVYGLRFARCLQCRHWIWIFAKSFDMLSYNKRLHSLPNGNHSAQTGNIHMSSSASGRYILIRSCASFSIVPLLSIRFVNDSLTHKNTSAHIWPDIQFMGQSNLKENPHPPLPTLFIKFDTEFNLLNTIATHFETANCKHTQTFASANI